MSSRTFEEYRNMTYQQVVDAFNEEAKGAGVGVSYYFELTRRDQDQQTRALLRYTRWITVMTVVVTLATIVSLLSTFCGKH